MPRLYLSLGSNVGDRERALDEAIARLRAAGSAHRPRVVALRDPARGRSRGTRAGSSTWPRSGETDSCAADARWICASRSRTRWGESGTVPGGPRCIDIDVLMLGDEIVSTPELRRPASAHAPAPLRSRASRRDRRHAPCTPFSDSPSSASSSASRTLTAFAAGDLPARSSRPSPSGADTSRPPQVLRGGAPLDPRSHLASEERSWAGSTRPRETGRMESAAAEHTSQMVDRDPAYASQRDAIAALITRGAFEELQDAFGSVIPFGTGGRRGPMGPGPNRINERTIGGVRGRASPATCSGHGRAPRDGLDEARRIVIAYDTRRNSRAFAEVAASVVAANGLEALLFEWPPGDAGALFRGASLCAERGDRHQRLPQSPRTTMASRRTGGTGAGRPSSRQAIIDEVVRARRFRADGSRSRPPSAALFRADRRGGRPSLQTAYTAGLSLVPARPSEDRASRRSTGRERRASRPRSRRQASRTLAGSKGSGARILISLAFRAARPIPRIPPPSRWRWRLAKATDARPRLGVRSGCRSARRRGGPPRAVGVPHREQDRGPDLRACRTIARGQGERSRRMLCFFKTCVTSDLFDRIAEAYGIRGGRGFPRWVQVHRRGDRDDAGPRGLRLRHEESHGYLRGAAVRDKDAAQAAILLAERAAELGAEGRTLRGCSRSDLGEVRVLLGADAFDTAGGGRRRGARAQDDGRAAGGSAADDCGRAGARHCRSKKRNPHRSTHGSDSWAGAGSERERPRLPPRARRRRQSVHPSFRHRAEDQGLHSDPRREDRRCVRRLPSRGPRSKRERSVSRQISPSSPDAHEIPSSRDRGPHRRRQDEPRRRARRRSSTPTSCMENVGQPVPAGFLRGAPGARLPGPALLPAQPLPASRSSWRSATCSVS